MSPGLRVERALLPFAIAFAAVNLLTILFAGTIRDVVDTAFGRIDAPERPAVGNGVLQELMVYYDPWLARFVLPVVYVAGFAVVAWLLRGTREAPAPGRAWFGIVALGLLEVGWLAMFATQTFCRGPHWCLYWPGEVWDPFRVEALPRIDLSTLVWRMWLGRDAMPAQPLWREAPGFVLLAVWFALGWGLAMGIGRSAKERVELATAFGLLQIAALVPLKFVAMTLFSVKYFVSFPDLLWNV